MAPVNRPFRYSIALPALVALVSTASCTAPGRAGHPPPLEPAPTEPTVVGRAVLPADTFLQGPPSGRWLDPAELRGRPHPFPSQPVQGFSGVIAEPDGTLLAIVDNGYGAIENSADFHLRVYRLRSDFEAGTVEPLSFFELSDPDRRVPFAIVNDFSPSRVLTGADFDIEAFQRAPDGTYWFGDEFGPFLLHTDAQGKVLEPPYPLPDFENGGDLRTPQNPFLEDASALRVMNAMREHALARGGEVPVLAPWHVLLVDGDPTTANSNRTTPPEGSGLAPASSEIIEVKLLRKAGFRVVPFTVNEPERMRALLKLGVDGLISDDPATLVELLRQADPEALLPDGRIDRARFDAQGHRGARAVRPENTLPSMEAALDALVTTLETDVGLTSDGRLLLSHDFVLEAKKCRRVDGARDEPLITARTLAELQRDYICDVKLAKFPKQRNELALSPVSAAFAAQSAQLAHPYTPPTLEQLFAFVDFYATYYATGEGRTHPEAARRAANAREVRFNIEAKVNPEPDFAAFSPDGIPLARAVIASIRQHGLPMRVDFQSFDWNTLKFVQAEAPELRTSCLIGDFPLHKGPDGQARGLGNLNGKGGANTPWLAGLYWPYRQTTLDHPVRVRQSGGFEGMALSPDGTTLWPLLEKPLADDTKRELLAHAFDLRERRFTGKRWRYPLEERTTSVGDFVLYGDGLGLAIERDDSQGDLGGFKRVHAFAAPGGSTEQLRKLQLIDLLRLRNRLPGRMSVQKASGTVGLGDPFAFPFVTIESIVVLSPTRIAVLNDNNYPFSVGRHVQAGEPDASEVILIDLPSALPKGL
jgi:glycerophosphoryl diester phosphodiesterase